MQSTNYDTIYITLAKIYLNEFNISLKDAKIKLEKSLTELLQSNCILTKDISNNLHLINKYQIILKGLFLLEPWQK